MCMILQLFVCFALHICTIGVGGYVHPKGIRLHFEVAHSTGDRRSDESNGKATTRANIPHEIRYQRVESALLSFQAEWGHMNVPHNFTIPLDDMKYSEHVRGMKLGIKVSNIRNNGMYQRHHKRLGTLGFNFERKPQKGTTERCCMLTHIATGEELYFQSIAAAARELGLHQPTLWKKAKEDSTQPYKSWLVSSISEQRFLAAREAGGENVFVERKYVYQDIFDALLRYKELHGDLHVPVEYIVNDTDMRYQSNTRGLNLGERLQSIRFKGKFRKHREQLLQLGVEFPKGPGALRCVLTNTGTGEKRTFQSMLSAANAMNLDRLALWRRIRDKSDKPYQGWIVEHVPIEY